MTRKQPANLTDNALYFTAFTEEAGTELYQLDPGSHTPILIDINPGPGDSFTPGLTPDFTKFNGQVYFAATTAETGRELYRLAPDGTPTLVADLNPGPGDTFSTDITPDFTKFNGHLYFAAGSVETGFELYKLAPNGTVTLIDIEGTNSFGLFEFTEFNNKLYFSALSDQTGFELYELSPGHKTPRLIDIEPEGSSFPNGFTKFNGQLYFQATTAATGAELYRLGRDGTPTLVADIVPGPDGSGPGGFTKVNNKLYFTATTAENGFELYELSPGHKTPRLIDINPGAESSFAGGFTEFNGRLYFTASTAATGSEL
jgi:ELWxxDGT repeat protein